MKNINLKKLIITLTSCLSATAIATGQDKKLQAGTSLGTGLVQQQYLEANRGNIGGSFVTLMYGNTPFLAYQYHDKIYFHTKLILQHEENPEFYDTNRLKNSIGADALLHLPIIQIDEDLAIALNAKIDWTDNSPQYTDYENRQIIALDISKVFHAGSTPLNLDFEFGKMRSEHEDDDEAPLADFGYGRDTLYRLGYGDYAKIQVDVYPSNNMKLSFSAEKYKGTSDYDNETRYERSDYKIALRKMMDKKKTLECGIAIILTERDKEIKLEKVDDQLLSFNAECSKKF